MLTRTLGAGLIFTSDEGSVFDEPKKRKERIKNVLVVVGDVQSMENRREPQKQEKSFCFSMI